MTKHTINQHWMSQRWTNNARPPSILQCKGATSDVLIWLQYFVLVQYPEICVVYVGTPAAASSLTFCLVWWLRSFVSYVSDCLASGMRPWANYIGSLAFWSWVRCSSQRCFVIDVVFGTVGAQFHFICVWMSCSVASFRIAQTRLGWNWHGLQPKQVLCNKTCFRDLIILVCVWWLSH